MNEQATSIAPTWELGTPLHITNPYVSGSPLTGAVRYALPYGTTSVRICWTRSAGNGWAHVQNWAGNWTTE
jgi:hypothetical protein